MNKKIILGAVGLLGIILFAQQSKAKSNSDSLLPDNIPSKVGVDDSSSSSTVSRTTVTDLDNLYNYYRENGIWFTQRKGSDRWINMKLSLSESDYNLAVSRLENHLAKKGLNGLKYY